MSLLDRFHDRFGGRFRFGDARSADLDAELELHMSLARQDREARGETARDAALAARREFGNVTKIREATRDAWSTVWIERLLQDVRFGARMLGRTPGITAIAVLCLALGVGANAAVLSWTEGILLRPYPGVADQSRLVSVAGTAQGDPNFQDMSWLDFRDLAAASPRFSSFIASKITGAMLGRGDRAERLVGQLVSANYFGALGVTPLLGRGFRDDEGTGAGAHPVVVISYRLWQDHFAGARNVIGQTVELNGVRFAIIGVAPPEFRGTFVGYAMQFWATPSMQAAFDDGGYKLDDRAARWIEGLARLAPGVTVEQAQAVATTAARRLARDYPDADRGRGVQILPLWKSPFDNAQTLLPMLRAAGIVVAFVLLIACANVANLLLVRAFARRHEMTVRMTLGAGRDRLIRQMMTEGSILAAVATAAGILCANWGRGVLPLFFAPRNGSSVSFVTELDWRVLATSAAIGLGSTLCFALVPALRGSRVDLASALKADSRSASGSRGRSRLRSGLVVLQVSLSFVLLVGAALVLMSLQRIRAADPGFSKARVTTTAIDLFAARYDERRARSFAAELLQSVRTAPGIESAALAESRPFNTRPYEMSTISVDGYDAGAGEQPSAPFNAVSPGYFATMGIPLLRGRDFSMADADTSAPVAIVSEAMAAKYWPRTDPVGRRLRAGSQWMQVVGVVKDIQIQSLTEPARPLFYVPLTQRFSTAFGIYVRTDEPVGVVGPALTRQVHALDPNLPPHEVLTMGAQVDRSTASQQVAVTLLGIFGVLALVLATIGVYGVMSYSVSQSRRELGLRLALGAAPAGLLRLVMRRGFALTASGIVLGAAASAAATRLLGDLLFEVSPRSPVAFGAALALMAAASIVACFVPAWRASRTDAVTALRV